MFWKSCFTFIPILDIKAES